MDEYKVYVRTDSGGIVTDINSSAFVSGDGWTEIDCGEGDKFHHAQGNYLERGLTDPDGIYNYKLAGGVPVLRPDTEKAPERARLAAALEIAELKQKLAETDYISAKIAEGAATREENMDKLADAALITLLIFMGVDYATGLIVAGVFHKSEKTENGALESRAGWKGLCRKGVSLLVVLVACRLDMIMGSNFIRDATVIAFIANETISIIENAGLMGVPIPSVITKAIEVLKKKSEREDKKDGEE